MKRVPKGAIKELDQARMRIRRAMKYNMPDHLKLNLQTLSAGVDNLAERMIKHNILRDELMSQKPSNL